MNEERKQRIATTLKDMGVKLPCPRCSSINFEIVDQTKISISFYKFSSPTSVELLKTINSKTIIMVLENQCQSGLFRFTRIITGDGEVGYIDSYYHYEDGETMKKIV